MLRVTVTYLDNSGFVLKWENRCLIFDYYNLTPREGTLSDGVVRPEDMKKKRTTVFVSHSHYDHYHPGIFDLEKEIPDIRYVLSDDIRKQSSENKLLVAPGQDYRWDDMFIHTLRSTDLGVAFLIKIDGMTIYHAGDLNWWHWIGEPEENNRKMAEHYLHEIDSLPKNEIDLAFVPTDPRQEHNYLLGLQAFMERVSSRYVIPMHFGGRTEVFQWMRRDPRTEGYRTRILELSKRGQSIGLNL